MFTERELLIMSYSVDVIAHEGEETFFSYEEAEALCNKIHNVLRAIRQDDQPPGKQPDGEWQDNLGESPDY